MKMPTPFAKFKIRLDELYQLEYHDELNPKLFTDSTLKSEIREKLLAIGNEFIKYVNVPLKVKDIVFCGGNANYNYTPLSDIDVHIIAKFPKRDRDLLKALFMEKKATWGMRHDIKIAGYPVELYIQPDDEEFVSGQGIYSLQSDKWIQEPKKQQVDVDDTNLKSKVEDLKKQIDDAINATDEKALQELADKIYSMRNEGLHRGGEFSLGTMVFKALRNEGYLDKLNKTETLIYDKRLSY